jgi:hypothetical protein
MKSREGVKVDADNLLDRLEELAMEEIRAKGREQEVEDIETTVRRIALGALNYYLLQVTPTKDITFDPAASISFTGDTGPYLQYTGARICSILRKYRERSAGPVGQFRGELLTGPEWQMVKTIASYPEWVYQAAKELNPSGPEQNRANQGCKNGAPKRPVSAGNPLSREDVAPGRRKSNPDSPLFLNVDLLTRIDQPRGFYSAVFGNLGIVESASCKLY